MKKKYLTPRQVVRDLIMLEENFLASGGTESAAPDLEYDPEIDPWS